MGMKPPEDGTTSNSMVQYSSIVANNTDIMQSISNEGIVKF